MTVLCTVTGFLNPLPQRENIQAMSRWWQNSYLLSNSTEKLPFTAECKKNVGSGSLGGNETLQIYSYFLLKLVLWITKNMEEWVDSKMQKEESREHFFFFQNIRIILSKEKLGYGSPMSSRKVYIASAAGIWCQRIPPQENITQPYFYCVSHYKPGC